MMLVTPDASLGAVSVSPIVPAMRLSPSYTLLDAFGDFTKLDQPVPSARQIGNARVLAQQLEMLRVIAGGRPLEVRAWRGARDLHPEGEGHESACAADLIAPNGITDQALAFHAHALGFFHVIKLGGNLVHIEIGEGEQHALSRVARNNVAPRLEQDGTGLVDRDTPTMRMMRKYPIEAVQVLIRIAGAQGEIDLQRGAPQLVRIWDAVDRLIDCPAEVRRALMLVAVGLGTLNDDTYMAFGPRWWQREILGGRRAPTALMSTAWTYHAPEQWGRIGPWQTLRSTALCDGFSALDAWTTTQQLRGAGVVDPDTGKDAGDLVGTAGGPLAQLDVAALYAARAMRRALEVEPVPLTAVRRFYAENDVENAAGCVLRAALAEPVLARIHDVRVRTKES